MRLMQLRLHIRAAVPSGVVVLTAPYTSMASRRPALPAIASTPWSRLPSGIVAANSAVEGHRFASVKAQGAYKLKNKKTIAKKMGAKRVGEQYVLPGTIIYKQRGTIWHPGENTILGRSHTIHASIAGYVKYYRDPALHPRRQYIGVTFERDDTLPYSSDAARKRRLGLVAVPRRTPTTPDLLSKSGLPRRVVRRTGLIELSELEAQKAQIEAAKEDPESAAVQAAEAAAAIAIEADASGKKETKATRAARRWNAYVRIKRSNRVLFLGKNYSYSESNVQIGRLMGTHKGKTPGTQRYGSRHGMLRHRRKVREEETRQARELQLQQKALAESTRASGGKSGSGGGRSNRKKATKSGKKAAK